MKIFPLHIFMSDVSDELTSATISAVRHLCIFAGRVGRILLKTGIYTVVEGVVIFILGYFKYAFIYQKSASLLIALWRLAVDRCGQNSYISP